MEKRHKLQSGRLGLHGMGWDGIVARDNFEMEHGMMGKRNEGRGEMSGWGSRVEITRILFRGGLILDKMGSGKSYYREIENHAF